MAQVIHFQKKATYIGRNGTVKMISIVIHKDPAKRVISLIPVNRKGMANYELKIPSADLNAFIVALQKEKRKKTKK